MSIVLAEELVKIYDEITALDFYRDIFPVGELDIKDVMTKGKYTGIAVEITNDIKESGNQLIKRYSVTDELSVISELVKSDNFCVISPISYIGKSRKSVNARMLYALCIEIDNLQVDKKTNKQIGLYELLHQCSDKTEWLPTPTYIVASGNGLHLYYVFEQPIPLFKNIVKELAAYKKEMTKKMWNKLITYSYEEKNIQYESLFQAFRMVGTITKSGERTRAFKTGEKVSIDYMNRFVNDTIITTLYKSNLTLAEAKNKYPKWYDERIEQRREKGSWVVKRDLYDWWKRRILNEGSVGHRYYCLMCLCIYAIKSDISRDELERDCFELMKAFDELTDNKDNQFTEKDVLDALQSFEDKSLMTYPINSIINRSGIHIEKNKRNYRKQKDHIKLMNYIRDEINQNKNWREGNGRPTAEQQVSNWRNNNPTGRKIDCIREIGLSKKTVYKWWKVYDEIKENERLEKQRKEEFIKEVSNHKFAESEVTTSFLREMADKGVREINVIPDEEYEEFMGNEIMNWLLNDYKSSLK